MSKIRIKQGTVNQKVEIVKGMYITAIGDNVFKIDIKNPIDSIIAIWKGAEKDTAFQFVKDGKKEILKLLEGVEEDNRNGAKRKLVEDLRNIYKYFIKDNETEYKECMEFIRDFESDREKNYAVGKEYCEFLKEQIERVERSIK